MAASQGTARRARVAWAVLAALLFGFVAFWVALMAGTGEGDVGLAGSRPMLLVWWAAAVGVGAAGVAVALRLLGRRRFGWWLLLGALPVAPVVATTLVSWNVAA